MSLTKEQIENLIEENNQKLRAELLRMASDAKPRTGRINCVSELTEDDTYYVLQANGVIYPCVFNNAGVNSRCINQGNTAWDKATLERKAKLNELNTRARAASAKAGVIDWRNRIQVKYFVYFDSMLNVWNTGTSCRTYRQGCTYFLSRESVDNFMQSLTPDEQRLFAGGDV